MSGVSVKAVVALIVASAISACSTVIRSADNGDDAVMTEERAALKEAAADLAWSPWPHPQDASLGARFAGASDDDGMTRARAVDVYLASLADAPDASQRIAADARRHLVAAAALADAAERAGEGPSPRLADVSVIETSIADLRETRAVYIAALKKIDAGDDAIDAIKDPLDAAVKRLGRAADDLAENAMKQRSSGFAGPDVRTAQTGAL